jgi:acid phosphatase
MVISAMYPTASGPVPLQIQPASIDSLEPAYTCLAAEHLSSNYYSSSNNANWTLHLNASQALLDTLDAVSGVSPSDKGFHMSWDHYYDNLSARQCHKKPLPCNISNPKHCVSQQQTDTVYRLGQYEYSYIYRGAPQSLPYGTASYGIWLAELVQSMRDVIAGTSKTKYRHNVAHDGSISQLLAILQIDVMVWPGMGSEVVFEVWRKSHGSKRYLRVLWGGQVLKSSNPTFGAMDMINLETFFSYIDGLVGRGATEVPKLCETS